MWARFRLFGQSRVDWVMVTGAAGNDNPYFRALLDLEEDGRGQIYLFDTGYFKLTTYDQTRERGSELVTVLHENISVEVVAEVLSTFRPTVMDEGRFHIASLFLTPQLTLS